jgi:hypothetical protein
MMIVLVLFPILDHKPIEHLIGRSAVLLIVALIFGVLMAFIEAKKKK